MLRSFGQGGVAAAGLKCHVDKPAETDTCCAVLCVAGALVMLSPVITGTLFGTRALAGLLAGALVSGVQMAVSMSNTGGAWDNAKKYIEVRSSALCGQIDGCSQRWLCPTNRAVLKCQRG